MISSRYALPAAMLLAAVLIPTVIHNYIGAKADDGLMTSVIPGAMVEFTSTAGTRPSSWGQATFDSDDWLEREYRHPDGRAIRLFIARSYDAKKVYHHPELAIVHGVDLESEGSIRLPEHGDIPLHILRGRTGNGLAIYALLYRDTFVENPVLFQLQTSLELLAGARRQMTLFFVYDGKATAATPLERSTAAELLYAAIDAFKSQPSGKKLEPARHSQD